MLTESPLWNKDGDFGNYPDAARPSPRVCGSILEKGSGAVPLEARWYANYGAVALSNKPLTLVMSLATFAADLKAAGQL